MAKKKKKLRIAAKQAASTRKRKKGRKRGPVSNKNEAVLSTGVLSLYGMDYSNGGFFDVGNQVNLFLDSDETLNDVRIYDVENDRIPEAFSIDFYAEPQPGCLLAVVDNDMGEREHYEVGTPQLHIHLPPPDSSHFQVGIYLEGMDAYVTGSFGVSIRFEENDAFEVLKALAGCTLYAVVDMAHKRPIRGTDEERNGPDTIPSTFNGYELPEECKGQVRVTFPPGYALRKAAKRQEEEACCMAAVIEVGPRSTKVAVPPLYSFVTVGTMQLGDMALVRVADFDNPQPYRWVAVDANRLGHSVRDELRVVRPTPGTGFSRVVQWMRERFWSELQEMKENELVAAAAVRAHETAPASVK